MKEYILSIDQGTTSIRAIFFNHDGDIVSVHAKEFAQFYPDSGWVEQDPMEMWAVTGEVIEKAMDKSNIKEEEIVAIGITNQRETSIVWDKNTGEPVYNAIVWQDRRTAEYCDQLKADDPEIEAVVRNKTGLMIDSYFSATKVKWILDNVEGARERAQNGDLLFGNVDTWIMWKLTDGKAHATDYSNASRTLMFNINELKWDEELLKVFDVPASMLPNVQESSSHFGVTSKIFKRAIPITGDAGDQQAATFGQCCFQKGMAKFTYGTAGVMTVNIGDKPFLSNNGLTTTIGWGLNGKVEYLLEAVAFSAGSAIQWLRDEMDMLDESPDSEYFALKTKKVMLDTEVLDIMIENKTVKGVKTNKGDIEAKVIINAAGLYADKIAAMVEDIDFEIKPRKGQYFLYDKKWGNILTYTIYSAPTKVSKGMIVVPTIDGNILAGSNAEALEDKTDLRTTAEALDQIYTSTISHLFPELPRMGDVITTFTGLRAASSNEDFIIEAAKTVKGMINVAGIQSPGLTSAPAIAVMVEELVRAQNLELDFTPKANYEKGRKAPVMLAELSYDERNALIEKEPAYGEIICRCESISKGEIKDAIHRPVPATNMDAIKRRVRAGMGRCQGGFCGPKVLDILSRELNISPLEVTQKGNASFVLAARNKELPLAEGDQKNEKIRI